MSGVRNMTCFIRLAIHSLLCAQVLFFVTPSTLLATDSLKETASTLFTQEEQQYLSEKQQIDL